MDGMKDKLEEATAQLGRLKATHGKHDEELGERQPALRSPDIHYVRGICCSSYTQWCPLASPDLA